MLALHCNELANLPIMEFRAEGPSMDWSSLTDSTEVKDKIYLARSILHSTTDRLRGIIVFVTDTIEAQRPTCYIANEQRRLGVQLYQQALPSLSAAIVHYFLNRRKGLVNYIRELEQCNTVFYDAFTRVARNLGNDGFSDSLSFVPGTASSWLHHHEPSSTTSRLIHRFLEVPFKMNSHVLIEKALITQRPIESLSNNSPELLAKKSTCSPFLSFLG